MAGAAEKLPDDNGKEFDFDAAWDPHPIEVEHAPPDAGTGDETSRDPDTRHRPLRFDPGLREIVGDGYDGPEAAEAGRAESTNPDIEQILAEVETSLFLGLDLDEVGKAPDKEEALFAKFAEDKIAEKLQALDKKPQESLNDSEVKTQAEEKNVGRRVGKAEPSYEPQVAIKPPLLPSMPAHIIAETHRRKLQARLDPKDPKAELPITRDTLSEGLIEHVAGKVRDFPLADQVAQIAEALRHGVGGDREVEIIAPGLQHVLEILSPLLAATPYDWKDGKFDFTDSRNGLAKWMQDLLRRVAIQLPDLHSETIRQLWRQLRRAPNELNSKTQTPGERLHELFVLYLDAEDHGPLSDKEMEELVTLAVSAEEDPDAECEVGELCTARCAKGLNVCAAHAVTLILLAPPEPYLRALPTEEEKMSAKEAQTFELPEILDRFFDGEVNIAVVRGILDSTNTTPDVEDPKVTCICSTCKSPPKVGVPQCDAHIVFGVVTVYHLDLIRTAKLEAAYVDQESAREHFFPPGEVA